MNFEEKQLADELLRQRLIPNIKGKLIQLKELLKTADSWAEDGVYRFYHQSFKVCYLQEMTSEMVKVFLSILPGRPLNKIFMQIISEGTGKEFELSYNKEWLKQTRPIVEAFYHAKYFLEMMIKYGEELENSPNMLPYGWAGVLYLYDLR